MQTKRKKVYHAIKAKKIIKQYECNICGRHRFTYAHHNDYNKPLDVEFLCGRCHRGTHGLQHLSNANTYPDKMESDLETSINRDKTLDEMLDIIDRKCYVNGTLHTYS